jgi:hypothetical protein
MPGRVDHRLAARLAFRAAVARIVAEHPELTSPDAQARLDCWLVEEYATEENTTACANQDTVLHENP